jgi:hypothetical protein
MFARSILIASAAIILAAATTGATAAPRMNDKQGAQTRAIGGATGKARLMALVGIGGAVIRSKGVTAVTHPSVGEYCIAPSDIVPASSIASVSVDWSNSSGNGNFVQYRSSGFGCPAGQFDVMTFQLQSGGGSGGGPALVLADTVAFTIVVP